MSHLTYKIKKKHEQDAHNAWLYRLEFLENNFTAINLTFLLDSTDPNITDLLQKEHPEILPK